MNNYEFFLHTCLPCEDVPKAPPHPTTASPCHRLVLAVTCPQTEIAPPPSPAELLETTHYRPSSQVAPDRDQSYIPSNRIPIKREHLLPGEHTHIHISQRSGFLCREFLRCDPPQNHVVIGLSRSIRNFIVPGRLGNLEVLARRGVRFLAFSVDDKVSTSAFFWDEDILPPEAANPSH